MRLFCLASALVFSVAAQPLAAQSLQCASRERVLRVLADQAQSRNAIGLAGHVVMEMFVDPETTRWTITVTLPDGRMCVLANGSAFEALDEAFPAQGVPS